MHNWGAIERGSNGPRLDRGGVVLRRWRPDDVSSIRQACGDDSICRFTTVPRCYGHAGALAWIEQNLMLLLTGPATTTAGPVIVHTLA